MSLEERFSQMILGVVNSQTLEQDEKDYIIEMLSEQLALEVMCRDINL
jgi:hypothetical protein